MNSGATLQHLIFINYFLSHINQLQGPVAHERDWMLVREWIELWCTKNTEACWAHLEAARPGEDWKDYQEEVWS